MVRSDKLPWITPQIQRDILLRNGLFKRHKKNPSSTTWEAYKIQRNKVTSLKRNGTESFALLHIAQLKTLQGNFGKN